MKKNEKKKLSMNHLWAKVDLCTKFETDWSSCFPVMMRHICIHPYRDYNFIYMDAKWNAGQRDKKHFKTSLHTGYPVQTPNLY